MQLTSINSALSTGRQVLVVEDELRVRDMLARALKEMGFQATLAGTAEAAVKALAAAAYDILILDLNLPGMDGIELLKLIRQRNNDIQVIILTGFGSLDSAKVAIHLDVVDFITKPYALGSLEVALDRARKRIRAKIMATGARAADEEPEAAVSPAQAFQENAPEGEALEETERRQILRVLQKHHGNRAQAAAELGISLRKLYYRIGEYQKKGLMP